ncbi:MAG: hypothetical protein ACPGXK_07165 [Phycisphaerae bacterium]
MSVPVYQKVAAYLFQPYVIPHPNFVQESRWPKLMHGLSLMGVVTLLSFSLPGILPGELGRLVLAFVCAVLYSLFLMWLFYRALCVHMAGLTAHAFDRLLIKYGGPFFAYLPVPLFIALVALVPGPSRRDPLITNSIYLVSEFGLVLTFGRLLDLRVYMPAFHSFRNLQVWIYLFAMAMYAAFIGVTTMPRLIFALSGLDAGVV